MKFDSAIPTFIDLNLFSQLQSTLRHSSCLLLLRLVMDKIGWNHWWWSRCIFRVWDFVTKKSKIPEDANVCQSGRLKMNNK